MRHFSFFLLLLLLGNVLHGQITLTKADMPVPGDSIYLSIPDSLSVVNLSETGPNSLWDFSILDPVLQQREIFLAPSQAPSALQFFFFGTTVVREVLTPDSVAGFAFGEGYEYFKASNSEYESMGFGGFLNGIPVPLINDPRDQIYAFPLTHDDTTSSFSVAELSVPGLVYVRREQNRTNIVDGWGSITTPYGTFDALRVQTILTGTDSVSFDTIGVAINRPISREYKWLANGEHLPVLQVNTTEFDSLGEVQTGILYLDSARQDVPLVGIAKPLPAEQLSLYPNPTSDQVFLDGSFPFGESFTLCIYTLDGKMVHQQALSSQARSLNVNALPAGNYVVRVLGETTQYTGKLMIQR